MVEDRPYFKGWIHASAASLHLIIFPLLLSSLSVHVWSIWAYAFCTTGHFAVSAVFHLIPWTGRALYTMRFFDHSMVFLTIAATYWVFIDLVVPDIALPIKLAVPGITVSGILHRYYYRQAGPLAVALPYIGLGWVGIADIPCFVSLSARIPESLPLLVLAGCSHTTGALIYAARWPHLSSSYFGFHELAHVFLTAGSMITTYVFFTDIVYRTLN